MLQHVASDSDSAEIKDVDDDWLNVFDRYAGEASSERLQDMWSRVLAGEIRKSNTFSLKTLGFISELDERIAATFEKYASKVVWNNFLPLRTAGLKGQIFTDILELEEFGLTTGPVGIAKFIDVEPSGRIITYPSMGVLIIPEQKVEVVVTGVGLTRVGQEVFTILKPTFDEQNAIELTELIPKEHLSEIVLCRVDKTTQQYLKSKSLWQKPTPAAS